MRVGIGLDVHTLVSGRKLILGGVDIPHEKGLLGHSDADVLVHAVMDALLGAAAMGDIGEHFPDTDPRYGGISSIILLKKVVELIKEKGYACHNLDCLLIAQAPKVFPYRQAIRDNLALALGIEPAMINVKATTTEGLGFTGRKEGIAAQAVCTLTEINRVSC